MMYGAAAGRPPAAFAPRLVIVTLPQERRPSQPKGFEKNVKDGLSSETFNVNSNIASHDTREGLADADIIAQIMKEQRCTFDEARVRLVKERMVAAGVDPDTGLPLDNKALNFDAPRNKVTVYKDRNMVHRLIGDPNGDGYIGKAPDLQSAVDMAVEVPDGAYFTWHSPSLHNDYAGRLYVWTEKRAKIMGRNNPKIWLQQEGHVSGRIERLGAAAAPLAGGGPGDDDGPRVCDVEIYDNRNMVHARIKDIKSDGYAGLARTINEAVDLACQLYDYELHGEHLYFTWHTPQVNSLSLFGLQIGESDWAMRVYAWTEARVKEAGRVDPKTWASQDNVQSGRIRFQPRVKAAGITIEVSDETDTPRAPAQEAAAPPPAPAPAQEAAAPPPAPAPAQEAAAQPPAPAAASQGAARAPSPSTYGAVEVLEHDD